MDDNDLIVAMRNARAVIETVAVELDNDGSHLQANLKDAAGMLWCAAQVLDMSERLSTSRSMDPEAKAGNY